MKKQNDENSNSNFKFNSLSTNTASRSSLTKFKSIVKSKDKAIISPFHVFELLYCSSCKSGNKSEEDRIILKSIEFLENQLEA